MRLFEKIKNWAKGDRPGERLPEALETLRVNRRAHERFYLADWDIALLKLEEGTEGIVKDISYGGLAVKLTGCHLPSFEQSETLRGHLAILDRHMTCEMRPIRLLTQKDGASFGAFSLNHPSSETLLFIRDFIEPFKKGQRLNPLDKSMVQTRFQGEGWTCLRGDDPIDLIIHVDQESQKLISAMLTFQAGGQYSEIAYRDGKLTTSNARISDRPGPLEMGSVMEVSDQLNPSTLREGVFMLLGMSIRHRNIVAPLLHETLNHFEETGRGGEAQKKHP